MGTRVQQTHRYKATPERLFSLLTNRDFLAARYAASGACNVRILQCDCDEDGDFIIESLRDVPARMPELARKLVGNWNRLRHIEVWERAPEQGYHCSFSADATAAPVRMTGTWRLLPDPGGSVTDMDLTIRCQYPIIGATIARTIGDEAARMIEAEHAFLRQHAGG